MPVIVASPKDELFTRLEKSGTHVMSDEEARSQNIEPARIGLLNLMPAKSMEKTETHWLRAISRTVLQIEPVFVKFEDDPRGSSSRE